MSSCFAAASCADDRSAHRRGRRTIATSASARIADFFAIVAAVGRPHFDVKSRLDFLGAIAHAFDAVIADERDIAALKRGDDR